MTTQPCPACAEWRASGERTLEINRELVHRATVAEARATAAEHDNHLAHVVLNHRGAIADSSLVHRITTLVARLEDKLAAAEQREAEKDKALRAHRLVGAQLSNVAFNWAQPAYGLSERDREMLDSLRRQWDALDVPTPLASPSTQSHAPSAREKFAACVHCGLIANPEICSRCGRERDSGILPIDSPLRQPSQPPRSAPREAGAQPEAGEPKETT
jgi:hypothetical protein